MKKETVVLRRQGCSETLNCWTRDGYFFEIAKAVAACGGGYLAEISYPDESDVCKRLNIPESSRGQTMILERVKTSDDAKDLIIKAMQKELNVKIQFASYIKKYCYEKDADLRIHRNTHQDVYLTHFVYDVQDDCIKHYVSGIPIVTFQDHKFGFLEVNAIAEWLFVRNDDTVSLRMMEDTISKCFDRAYAESIKDHNQRDSERENRCWFAWLLNEYIKKVFPDMKPEIFPSMVIGRTYSMNDSVEVLVYKSKSDSDAWINGKFEGFHASKPDEEFKRVNVRTEDGQYFQGCHPDCVRTRKEGDK